MMTRTDRRIALAVLALAIFGSLLFLLLPKGNRPQVSVQAGDKEVLRLQLEGPPGTHRVQGPLGDSIVEVRDGQAHMLWSDCPDKICMNMGWIFRPGQVVICLPNQVVISIEEAR